MKRLIFGSITPLQMSPLLFFGVFAFAFCEYGLTLALPAIAEEYGKNRAEVQWITSAFFLGTAATSIPFGRLGDQLGQINTLRISFALSSIFNLLAFFIRIFYVQVALVFAIGACNSALVTSRNVMLRKGPSQENTTKTMSASQTLVVLTGLIVPLITGLVLQYLQWTYLFVFGAVLSLLSILILAFYKNPPKIPMQGKFDFLGTITIILAILSLCLMFTLLGFGQYFIAGGLLALSVVSIVVFIIVEKRHKNPIMPLYLLKNPLGDIICLNFTHFIISTGFSYTFPQYCNMIGISSSVMGILQTVSQVTSFLQSLVLPLVQSKTVHRVTLVLCFDILMICSMIACFFLENKIVLISTYVIFMTFATSLNQTLYPLMMMSVPANISAQVSIIPPTSRTLGQSLSYCLYSFVLQISIMLFKSSGQLLSFFTSMRLCLVVMMLLISINLILSIYRVGNPAYEKQKFGFKQRFLRQIEIRQQYQVELADIKKVK